MFTATGIDGALLLHDQDAAPGVIADAVGGVAQQSAPKSSSRPSSAHRDNIKLLPIRSGRSVGVISAENGSGGSLDGPEGKLHCREQSIGDRGHGNLKFRISDTWRRSIAPPGQNPNGQHLLAAPLVFTSADSGSAEPAITYAAAAQRAGLEPAYKTLREDPTLAPTDIERASPDFGVAGSDTGGAAMSTLAHLTTVVSPTILAQPKARTVGVGESATFQVTAEGTSPLAYQWWFNEAPLPDRTNTLLSLANLQTRDGGTYTVTVSNIAGVATSTPSVLRVILTSNPFARVLVGPVAADGASSIGCAWGDYNNDGWLDLFVANGGLTGAEPNFLYMNAGDGTLIRVRDGPVVIDSDASMGCGWADYDNDGCLDLFVANGFSGNANDYLYRNLGNTNHWLKVHCLGSRSNPSAIGAQVRINATLWGEAVGQHRDVVSDDHGSVVSEPARLTVPVKPSLTLCVTNYSVVQGGNLTLSAEVRSEGTLPITYVWRRISSIKSRQTNDSHRSFFTLTNVQPSEDKANGTYYLVNLMNVATTGVGLQSDRIHLTVFSDTDGDGMDDAWETAHGLNPADPTDAILDKDSDGLSNGCERQSGTNPTNALSYFKVEAIAKSGGTRIEFIAAENLTYSAEHSEDLDSADWHTLADVVAGPDRTVMLTDPAGTQHRYYRLVTPRHTPVH